jgi:hypothetical protein
MSLAGVLACAGPATRVFAHDLPEARWLLWASDAPDARPIVLLNRGLLFPASGGDLHYSLRCNEAYGASVSELTHARLAAADSAALLVVTSSLAARSEDHGCTWQPATGLPEVTLGGFTQPREPTAELLLSTIDPDGQSQVFASTDQGVSFAARASNGAGEVYTSLLVAPSDGQRVYARGARVNRQDNTIEQLWASSSDGGAHWQNSVVPRELEPLGVHPQNPQMVFAVEAEDELGTSYRVLQSPNAGEGWVTVLEGLSEVTSFAATPDAKLMWVGAGHEGGLYESRTGGASFVRVQDDIHEVHCLHQRLGKLWLCGNRAPNVDGVWVSSDGGASFDTVLTFDQVTEPVQCSAAESACVEAWRDWVLEIFNGKDPSAPADAGAGPPVPVADAGVSMPALDGGAAEPESRGSKDDGGCSLVHGRPPGGAALTLVALACLALTSRRRKLRSSGARAATRFP